MHIRRADAADAHAVAAIAIERLCDDAAACFLLGREELQEIANDAGFEGLVDQIGAFASARKGQPQMVAYNMVRVRSIDAVLYRRPRCSLR